MTEIEKLRERYDLQVQINRSLVEACAKSQDENGRLLVMITHLHEEKRVLQKILDGMNPKGRKVFVKQAAVWHDGQIVGYRDYEYKNPKGPV